MSITTRLGAIGALIVAVGLGLAACQTQGTATKIATSNGDIGPASWLAMPEGDGPFPAVVLMHGCSGTERNTQHQTVWRGLGRHAALLNENGYATLILDSFGPRRITDGCRRPLSYYGVQVGDALAAFDHLAALPFVDRERVGFVGFSLGGGTALRMVHAWGSAKQGRGNFAAYVAYYPYCEPWFGRFDRPVLILIGADDDWTPAVPMPPCSCPECRPGRACGLSRRAPFLRHADSGRVHLRRPHGGGKRRGAQGFAASHAGLLRDASRPGALRPGGVTPCLHPEPQDEPMTPSAFRAFTFDCYGTLIDWESGILQALRARPGIEGDEETLLAAFAPPRAHGAGSRPGAALSARARPCLQGDRGGGRPRGDGRRRGGLRRLDRLTGRPSRTRSRRSPISSSMGS